MLASTLIEELRKLIAEHGDLPVQFDANRMDGATSWVREVYFGLSDDETVAWMELSK